MAPKYEKKKQLHYGLFIMVYIRTKNDHCLPTNSNPRLLVSWAIFSEAAPGYIVGCERVFFQRSKKEHNKKQIPATNSFASSFFLVSN